MAGSTRFRPSRLRAFTMLLQFLQRRPSWPPRLRLDSPSHIPILPLVLHRVLGAPRAIAAGQRIGCAVSVTPPADPLGVFRIQRERLCHRTNLHVMAATMRHGDKAHLDADQANPTWRAARNCATTGRLHPVGTQLTRPARCCAARSPGRY